MSRRLVIDTNCVLDLLHFRDPRCTALAGALSHGDWVACRDADCRAEWLRVLGYPALALSAPQQQALLQRYDAGWRDFGGANGTGPTATLPRCRDPDDQKFLELAARIGAELLISRDDALLSLSRRLQRAGLFAVIAPAQFADDDRARPGGPG